MTDKHDNPPAFPRTGEGVEPGVGHGRYDCPGMSLLDYFAGQFMRDAWDIASSAEYEGDQPTQAAAIFTTASHIAYQMAWAMLAERERQS